MDNETFKERVSRVEKYIREHGDVAASEVGLTKEDLMAVLTELRITKGMIFEEMRPS